MNIILIGFKSSGKTMLGQALAQYMQSSWLDTDTLLEQEYSSSAHISASTQEIYARLGEEQFRQLEHAALQRLRALATPHVISTGGGVVCLEANRELLRQCGHVLFLDTPLKLLEQRLHQIKSPLLQAHALHTLYTTRKPLYEATAHSTLSIQEGQSPQALAEVVYNTLKPVIARADKHYGT